MSDQVKRLPTRREHALGITLSILVAVIWVMSSEMIQFILGSTNFDKPYIFTYLTTSVFSTLVFGFVRKSWRERIYAPSALVKTEYTSLGSATKGMKFNARDTARVSAVIGPLYFLANYVFNKALPMTSVASASTISNLSSLFTLVITVAIGVESFSWLKLLACCITISGAGIITGVDTKSGHVFGDGLAIFSAFLFALYTTVLKKTCPESAMMDMAMMLGFMGLIVTVFAWPVIPILSLTGIESFKLPSGRSAVLILANAAIGSVLSDFLWAKSVVLTSALVGNVALSLSVPLSLVFDSIFKGLRITPAYGLGVVLVVSGFIIVNIDLAMQKDKKGVQKTSLPQVNAQNSNTISGE